MFMTINVSNPEVQPYDLVYILMSSVIEGSSYNFFTCSNVVAIKNDLSFGDYF